MAGADSSLMKLAFEEEVTFGTAPATQPTDIRWTGESLKQDTSTTESQEIRDDRQIPDVVRTGINAAGDINFEFSYGAHDEMLQAALLSAVWTTAIVDVASGSITVPTTQDMFVGADGEYDNYTAGEWVLVAGFTNAANNGLFKIADITSSAPGTSDNDQLEVYATLAAETGSGIDITQGATIKAGTTLRTFTIEKEFTDLTNKYERCLGMAINAASMNVTADAIITGTFSFLGKSVASSATPIYGSAYTAAATNDVMNAIDHVSAIMENNADYDVTSFSWSLTNNLRARLQVGTLGAVSLGKGTIGLSGTVQAYFEDETVIDKYLNFTASSLALTFNDTDGNKYVIDFPRVKYTDGARVAGGQNQDILADMSFTAYRNSTEDCTMRIVRFPA